MTKAIFLTTIVPVLLILMLSLGLMGQKGCIDNSLVSSIQETRPLRLSDYPAFLKENTVIVIGQEALEIEKGAVDLIKGDLRESVGPQPAIKHDKEIIGNDKDSNLILIGLPSSNDLLQEFYATTGIDEVTSEYPGKNKGILKILRSPWSIEIV